MAEDTYYVSKYIAEDGVIHYNMDQGFPPADEELIIAGLPYSLAKDKVLRLRQSVQEYNKSLIPPSNKQINEDIVKELLKREKNKKLGYWEDYYAGADVGIFIGSMWVDDIITLQYNLTNNKSPIYGYMSETFDAVTRGTTIVQGQFAIAFKETGYLTTILENYKKENPAKITTIEQLLEEREGTAELAFSEKEKGNPRRADKWGYLNTKYGNIINRGFDITITYGDVSEEFRGGTVETLNNVHITSVSKVCEPTGDPIAEMYAFFAETCNENIPIKIFGKRNIIEDIADEAQKKAKRTPAQIAEDQLAAEDEKKAISKKDGKRKESWLKKLLT